MRTSVLVGTVVCALIVCACGCSNYSFSATGGGRGPKGASTVAVPILENQTLDFGLEQDVTDAIIREFQDNATLRVVGEEEADTIVRGAVVSYERPVVSYDAQGNPKEYKVRVVARLSYVNLRSKETEWEGDVEGWAVYNVDPETGEFSTEGEARAAAILNLSQSFLSKTVQGW
jgi:hypothetical protein